MLVEEGHNNMAQESMCKIKKTMKTLLLTSF